MIAKSIGVTFLLSFLISAPARAEIKNLYEKILTEYDIHPPSLQYGYPLWYQYDSLPITGIIFLKDDLDDLYRMDKLTYVAEPTKENAEVILSFSGDVGTYPKFYIVPDSNLTWREVHAFMQCLKTSNLHTQLILCGAHGKYINYFRERFGGTSCPGCIHDRDILTILQNCRGEIMAEGEFADIDSVCHYVSRFYMANHPTIGNKEDYGSVGWSLIDAKFCESHIQEYSEYLNNADEYFWVDTLEVQADLDRMKLLNQMVEEWGNFHLPSSSAYITVKPQWCDRLVGSVYELADEVNKGVYLARQTISLELLGIDYHHLFVGKKMKELQFIHLQIPDICRFYFEDDFPPPQPIEIYAIEEVEIQLDTLGR